MVWRRATERGERGRGDRGNGRLASGQSAMPRWAYGFRPLRISDVGVAGLHRVLDTTDEPARARWWSSPAWRAAASVIGGLLRRRSSPCPPASATAGARRRDGAARHVGIVPSGITVVGIDNGFGAACAVMRLFGARVDDESTRVSEGAASGPTAPGFIVSRVSPATWP